MSTVNGGVQSEKKNHNSFALNSFRYEVHFYLPHTDPLCVAPTEVLKMLPQYRLLVIVAGAFGVQVALDAGNKNTSLLFADICTYCMYIVNDVKEKYEPGMPT